jgi:hypothetical protein
MILETFLWSPVLSVDRDGCQQRAFVAAADHPAVAPATATCVPARIVCADRVTGACRPASTER